MLRAAITLALLLAAGATELAAQNGVREFWPEIDVYAQLGSQLRLIFVDSLTRDQNTQYRQGSFTYYLEVALRPVFRRDLRDREDVFRRRFLTFRAGYRYVTSLTSGDATSENRIIAESDAKYPLPGKFVAIDRNRGDFRFVKGEPFSMRWAQNTFALGIQVPVGPHVVIEPYGARQHNSRSTPRIVNALGLTLNCFF